MLRIGQNKSPTLIILVISSECGSSTFPDIFGIVYIFYTSCIMYLKLLLRCIILQKFLVFQTFQKCLTFFFNKYYAPKFYFWWMVLVLQHFFRFQIFFYFFVSSLHSCLLSYASNIVIWYSVCQDTFFFVIVNNIFRFIRHL